MVGLHREDGCWGGIEVVCRCRAIMSLLAADDETGELLSLVRSAICRRRAPLKPSIVITTSSLHDNGTWACAGREIHAQSAVYLCQQLATCRGLIFIPQYGWLGHGSSPRRACQVRETRQPREDYRRYTENYRHPAECSRCPGLQYVKLDYSIDFHLTQVSQVQTHRPRCSRSSRNRSSRATIRSTVTSKKSTMH